MRGYLCAFLAAILYGVQYAPVKAYPVYDGSKFQWFMSAGIAFSGLVAAMAFSHGTLYLIPYGVLGGILWGTANVMVIPAVKFLGLGVGFAMYHSINMAVGYAIGRFGLLGAPKEVARNPALRDGGLWMLIMSLVFMIFVEPEIDDKDETATGVKTGTQSDSQLATALEEGLAKPRTVELGEVKYETMHDAEPLHRLPSEKARHSQEPAPTASTLKMDLVLSKASLMRSQSLPRAMKDCPVRSMSVDQLEELSINASARAARQGYSNWRRGAAKGSVEISSGIVGVRSKVNKERIVRHIRDSPVLWPLYESGARATVRSHYRSMISSYQHDIGPSKATNRLTTCVEADNDPAEGSRLLETQRPQRATTKKPSEDDAGVQVKRRKFALGGIFGLFAGLLCGINMLPYVLYLEQQRSNDLSHTFDDTLSFFFSQCFGVFIAATALLALLALAARLAHIELKSPAVWPAWAAGTLWSAGFLLASVAVEDLGMAQAYTYDAIGPVMVSACISFIFGEIVGNANTVLFVVALSLQAVGVIAIAAGA